MDKILSSTQLEVFICARAIGFEIAHSETQTADKKVEVINNFMAATLHFIGNPDDRFPEIVTNYFSPVMQWLKKNGQEALADAFDNAIVRHKSNAGSLEDQLNAALDLAKSRGEIQLELREKMKRDSDAYYRALDVEKELTNKALEFESNWRNKYYDAMERGFFARLFNWEV